MAFERSRTLHFQLIILQDTTASLCTKAILKKCLLRFHQYHKSMCLQFIELRFYCDVKQVVNMPSRGNNIIDNFFTIHPSLIDKCVSILGMGDNDAVLPVISNNPQCNKPIKRVILLWNKADLSILRCDCNMFSSNFVLQSFPDVDYCWTVFRNNVIQPMNKYLPNKITRSRKTNA